MGNVAFCQDEIFGFNLDSTNQVSGYGLGYAAIPEHHLAVHIQLPHATKASTVRELCNISRAGTDVRLDNLTGMRNATYLFLSPLTTIFRISRHSNLNVVL